MATTSQSADILTPFNPHRWTRQALRDFAKSNDIRRGRDKKDTIYNLVEAGKIVAYRNQRGTSEVFIITGKTIITTHATR